MTPAAPLHPDLAPLAFLAGTWTGRGRGTYPTIEDFDYTEEITFSHGAKPFLLYVQRTWDTSAPRRPLHTETGYWRPGGSGRVEAVIAQPTGIVEVEEGTVSGTTIELTATFVGLTSTAKEVTTMERRLDVDGDELRYRLSMGAVGQIHQVHLEAVLVRRTG